MNAYLLQADGLVPPIRIEPETRRGSWQPELFRFQYLQCPVLASPHENNQILSPPVLSNVRPPPGRNMGSLEEFRRFLKELRRRNVYRVAATYVVVAFVGFQAAQLLVPSTVLPPWTDEFVLFVLIVGFPIALVVAWAFELSPDGVRRTSARLDSGPEEAAGDRPAARPARLAVRALVGLGILAAAVTGGWYLMGGGGTGDTAPGLVDRSVAVLPFDNLSETDDARPFVNGIHDGLLTRLAHISSLTVISRQAVERYRDAPLTAGAIADSLGVRWVVLGSVQKLGDAIQVSAQLVDPETEAQRWADSYRRDLTAEDLFALQSAITRRIARSLEAAMTRAEEERVDRRPTGDLDAYRLYVRGRRLVDQRTPESIREGIDLFRQALARDSSYALAWAGLADAGELYAAYAPDSLGPSVPDQKTAARRALQLDPDLAEAHASLGFAYWQQDHDAGAALEELERAVELKPSYAQAHHWLALMKLVAGRREEAREHAELGVELNPGHPTARVTLVMALLATGDYEEAEVRLGPDPPVSGAGSALTGDVSYHVGRWDELRRLARKRLEESGYQVSWLAYLALMEIAEGDTARGRAHLSQIRREWGSEVDGRHVAEGLIHAALGEREEAFAALQEVDEWPPILTGIVRYLYPDVLGPLRDDPRFRELIREVDRYWGLDPNGSSPG